jgi:hypothetical protein
MWPWLLQFLGHQSVVSENGAFRIITMVLAAVATGTGGRGFDNGGHYSILSNTYKSLMLQMSLSKCYFFREH